MKIKVTTGAIDGNKLGAIADYPTDIAKRLASLGYAEIVDDEPSAKGPSRAELQERCRELGLSDKGNKAELKARIDEFESAEDEEPEAEIEADADEPPALSAEVPQ